MNIYCLFLSNVILVKPGRSTEKAQGLVEYALVILLVALAVFGSLALFGGVLRDVYQQILGMFPSG